MVRGLLTASVCLALLACAVWGRDLSYPVHVHLSYNGNPTQMAVTWTTFTFNETQKPYAEFGLQKYGIEKSVNAESTVFVDDGSLKRIYYIHRAVFTDLTSGSWYVYHVGSIRGISDLYYFQAMVTNPNFAPRFAVYGDMGNVNARSLSRLQKETQKGMYDCILHVGDFAYNLESENGTVGDSFMDQIQSIAAYVPYMVLPGNHEENYNFSHFKNRFTMPNREMSENLFYSFNMGPAHFISYSSEFYYTGKASIKMQFDWLEADLKKATHPESLAVRPWVIVMAHRPMYCSDNDTDCPLGVKLPTRLALESLFCKYGVDLHIYAHEHSYERLWPVFDGRVYNGSTEEPYTNPGAPVHIVTGSAGCDEDIDPFFKYKPDWSAVRLRDYGYTRMVIHNSSHIGLEQVSDEQDGRIVDHITIKKSFHGPGTYKCQGL